MLERIISSIFNSNNIHEVIENNNNKGWRSMLYKLLEGDMKYDLIYN